MAARYSSSSGFPHESRDFFVRLAAFEAPLKVTVSWIFVAPKRIQDGVDDCFLGFHTPHLIFGTDISISKVMIDVNTPRVNLFIYGGMNEKLLHF